MYRRSTGQSARHHGLNDLIWRAVSAANVLAAKELFGLLRSDGKRTDRLSLIPWQNGRSITWDVTVTERHSGAVVSVDVIWRGSGGGFREEDSKVHSAGSDIHLGHVNSVGLQFLGDFRKAHHPSFQWSTREHLLPLPAMPSSYPAFQRSRCTWHFWPHT